MKLNVVCEFKAEDLESKTNFDISAIETVRKQRGIWNRDRLTWRVLNWTNDFEKERDIRYALNITFTEWDIELPIVFVEARDDEEADITIDFHYKKDDKYYSGTNSVIGYAGYPYGILRGVLVIFDDYDWNWHGQGGYNLIQVMIHEIGHILGFPHSTRGLREDVMDPYYNPRLVDLSSYDVEFAVASYGEREYTSPTGHDRLEKANRRQKERLIESA